MKILVEVPEGFSCHNCGVTTCDSYDPNHFGMKPSYCPLANAKEPVRREGGQVNNDDKLGLYISKKTYDLLGELVVAGITMLIEKECRTEAEVLALSELNNVKKELNEWAEAHNSKVVDEMIGEIKP